MKFTTRSVVFALSLAVIAQLPANAADAAPPAADKEVDALQLPRQADMSGEKALRFTSLYRPFTTDQAALSPDGKYLAYSIREGGELHVVVLEVDHPEKATTKVMVATDVSSTPSFNDFKESVPAAIWWMKWTSPTRLVVETNTNHVLPNSAFIADDAPGSGYLNVPGTIVAFDADGGNGRILLTPKDVAERVKDPEFEVEDRHARITKGATGGWSVDQPVAEGFIGQGPAAQATAPDASSTAQGADIDPNTRPASQQPRTPRIMDLVPKEPDWVYVTAGTPRKYEVYRLNTVTGKLVDFYEEVVTEEFAVLPDQAGKVRAAVPATTRMEFPHAYRIERFGGLSRWKKLDEVIDPSVASGFHVAPGSFFEPRSIPLGFDLDPKVLYYASNVGRDTFGIYGLNLETGKRTGLVAENPNYDLIVPGPAGFPAPSPLVFDRFTRQLAGIRYDAKVRTAAWLRPELAEVQKFLEAQLPGTAVEILEWNETGTRFLVLGRGPADPGSFYIFSRDTGKLSLFAQRAPWFDANRVHPTYDFGGTGPDGVKFSGNVTMPREIRRKPVPMVVICPTEPWLRTRSEYRTEVQALASMGFAVVQLNGRGTWGFGTKQRDMVRDTFEEKQVEDIVAGLDHLSRRLPLDLKRVAIYGEKRGGWLALRAVQLRPGRFRCAVVVDPTVNLVEWAKEAEFTTTDPSRALVLTAFGGMERLRQSPLVKNPELVTKPILVLAYPGLAGTPRLQEYLDARTLVNAVAKTGVTAELYDLSDDYQSRLPKGRSTAMREVETFLNATIYDFGVEMGDLKEMK